MLEKIIGETLYICSNRKKEIILEKISETKKLYNIKFMTKEEFEKEYFFKYSVSIFPYMMEKYSLSFVTAKEYLKNLYPIDIDKTYSIEKLDKMKNIKKDLIENNYLIFNKRFKTYLNNKNIIVDYPYIDSYLKKELKKYNTNFINETPKEKNIKVEEYDDIESEVNSTILKILNLKKQGVSLNDIIIVCNSDEYKYTLKTLFKLYNIPLDIDLKISLNTSLFINEYFITKKIKEINENNKNVVNKFINLLNKYVEIEDSKYYKEIIKEELKHTYINNQKYKESVKVITTNELEIENKHIFILGFNEGIIPNIKKDEDFFSDQEKSILSLLTSVNYNYYERENIYTKITNIKDINISYVLHGFSEEYFPSSMINDYNMEIVKNTYQSYNYSSKYNKRKLSILLDNYYKYKEKDQNISKLLNTYENTYDTYNHKFTGINHENYINYINKPLNLSYTAINSYNLCPFKYYINYVLKIDPFEDTFMTFIGNLYHKLFSLCFYDNFDFEKEYEKYIENRNLSPKENFLLKRLKKELLVIIEVLKEQKMYTDFKESFYEKELFVPLDNYEIEVIFKGIIDKIMYYQNGSDTYYAVIDYKTGSFPTSLNNLKYGLDMQLAIYVYLIEKTNLFDNPIFTGCYFQKTFLGNIITTKNKTIKEVINDSLKLKGYSTPDELILSHFDHDYTNSKIISSKLVTDKGFSSRTKILDEDEIYNMVNYTDSIIKTTTTNILNNKFDISPKVIGGNDKACMYCKYKDICYKDINDNIELPKVEDLTFLGGEEDGK